jgi:hypothetical protein
MEVTVQTPVRFVNNRVSESGELCADLLEQKR